MAQGKPLLKDKDKPRKQKKKPVGPIRNKCDGLLTPIVKLTTPRCEGCGRPTEVAHHWIEKSRSLYLRYDFSNLIALCHSCHAKIHNRFGNNVVGGLDIADQIVKKRGAIWYEELKILAREIVKGDYAYFENHYSSLQEKLKQLNGSID